ncbi:hypothetical protein [Tenacibaculum phage JQ]|nr:hypothetical protein [Tenacibaculum phage JQ]
MTKAIKLSLTSFCFYNLLGYFKIMFKWITNSKGRLKNKYKGVFLTKDGYRAEVIVEIPETRQSEKKIKRIYLGYYNSEKEARDARINYILNLL